MTQNNEITRVGQHHSFDADLAAQLKSIDLAVLVQHFQFWIRHNAAMKQNLHEERTWTYQTLKDIAAHFPYWSHKQVERLILKLVELKILIKGNFNKSPYDRTVWYAFENEKMFSISRNREMEIRESGNEIPEIGTPIPDTLKKKKKKRETSFPSIEFDYETEEFSGIQEKDLEEWKSLFPNVDIQRELRLMRQWLINPSNPERDGNRTFVTNWLNKAMKDSSKTPKKPIAKPDPEQDDAPAYNPSIAYNLLHRDGVEKYEYYLSKVSDKKYYENYKKGIYEKDFIQFMNEKDL